MTLRYLLDTNVLSEPVRRRPDPVVLEQIRRHEAEMATASIVWHELAYGCRRLPPASQKRCLRQEYLAQLQSSALPVLPYDMEAATWHASERARLSAAGLTPSFVDGQVAAIARTAGLTVVTNNVRSFRGFHGLEVESWHRPVNSSGLESFE